MQTTRERLLAAMADALQRQGYHGVGLNQVLAQARAPKGVLYHHFPGGKMELAVAALDLTVDRICHSLDQVLRPDPLEGLRQWLERARQNLNQSHFERGCPLATVALESTAQDVELRACLSQAFTRIRARVAGALEETGRAPEQARGLAALIVSTYEGALLQARVAGQDEPLRLASQSLLALLQ